MVLKCSSNSVVCVHRYSVAALARVLGIKFVWVRGSFVTRLLGSSVLSK